ncbi:hypothetical protein GWI33_014324 [Rhynchophorus ferrugineus]|uniref:Uncharacterized protein n=1 Tax=Rhynchophorus ferrugineus TaxID=354439 RepID=A0A834I2U5_RHYFE|nr:hypothetical protein GWI33_014324 [Rhynchophorus ferrugineus]
MKLLIGPANVEIDRGARSGPGSTRILTVPPTRRRKIDDTGITPPMEEVTVAITGPTVDTHHHFRRNHVPPLVGRFYGDN